MAFYGQSGIGIAATMDLSIVLEWDNLRTAGWRRGASVLQALAREIVAHDAVTGGETEVLFMFSPDAVNAGVLAALAGRCLPRDVRVRLVPRPGEGYYHLKNAGVAAATHDRVVMLDSDTIPQPGWLGSMARALATPGVDAVAGVTTVDRDSRYARAVARLWFFPANPPPPGPIFRTREFWANNAAFRREVFLGAGGFPEAGLFRGQCRMLAARLIATGRTIWLAPEARTVHSPPRGLVALCVRAVRHGRDAMASAGPQPAQRRLAASWRRAAQSCGKARQALADEGGTGPVPADERWLTMGLALLYSVGRFLGERWEFRHPRRDSQQANS